MTRRQVLQVAAPARLQLLLAIANGSDASTAPSKQLAATYRRQRLFMRLPMDDVGHLPGVGVAMSPAAKVAVMQAIAAAHRAPLAQMQSAARELLQQASEGKMIEALMDGRVALRGADMSFSGSPIEVFRMTVAWLLTTTNFGRVVKQCPECRLFFARRGRQIYCRDKCTDRATWRNYPEDRKRESRKKQYDRFGWTVGARKKKGAK